MTFLDAIRKQFVGKTIVRINRSVDEAGSVIKEIRLDNYEPIFIILIVNKNGEFSWHSILEDWEIVVEE